jgi:hypothetical protein
MSIKLRHGAYVQRSTRMRKGAPLPLPGLGHDHFDGGAKTKQTNRRVTRLENLGYSAQITALGACPKSCFL